MAEKILVPLKRRDRIEALIPYIERIVQPGMKILFLVPFPVDSFEWWREDRLSIISMDDEIESKLAVRIARKYPWELQRQLAVERVFSSCETLRKRGIDVRVDVYAGTLRKLVKDYARCQDVQLIVMPIRSFWRTRLLSRTFLLFGLFNRTSSPPVMLLHPGGVL
jgi:hypothetical protein